jgi:type VI secretion system protein ImpM
MPRSVEDPARDPGPVPALPSGFYGKLPARGDFVCQGLPRGFTDPWDAWVAGALAGSRDRLGEGWTAAWLEAPIWRFSLAPGLCGGWRVLGVMLPSVDRVGRYFPLGFAALFPADTTVAGNGDTAWLDRCEAAGLAALERDAEPAEVLALMGPPPERPAASDGSAWWGDGGPRVPAGRRQCAGLPGPEMFASMLDQPPLYPSAREAS